MTATCTCGHPREMHEHLRRGADCGQCGRDVCPSYVPFDQRPVWRPRVALLVTAVAILAGLVLIAWWGQHEARSASTRCESTACLRKALTWQRHDRARLQHQLRLHEQTRVELAYRLALGLYHVDLRHLGYCESTNDPFSRTGQYVGITQQGDNFQARNRDMYRLLPVTDPIANVLVAARWISQHGSSEWQCRLDGSVKHGGAYS